MTRVTRALLSVSDKTGLVDFARRLASLNVQLVSSGGTAAALEEAGLAVTPVSKVTGAPEMLGGRVKTLHPAIHGAILARPDLSSDLHDLGARGIEPFQLVVCNLYPFQATAADPSSSKADVIQNIDIGGPAMIRAAAKNHDNVAVVTSPSQYGVVAAAIEDKGRVDEGLRHELAVEAFFHTASYDAAIASWIGDGRSIALRSRGDLRYGENPHQAATIYIEGEASPWWDQAIQHQGKEMSFNNYADAEAAWRLASDLPAPAAVVVKHMNPAGAASAATVKEAFEKAWAGDSLAAFGGVVAINGALDEETAATLADRFIEVVVALDASDEALAALAGKKNLRVLTAPPPSPGGIDYRRIEGGLLAQDRDEVTVGDWQVVSKRSPSPEESADLQIAWIVAAHTKSNAIVIARDGHAVGVGAGDQSRVGAADRAVARAGDRAQGAVAASDGFFPFRDGIDTVAKAGVTAVVEPGGSIRDDEVIAAADEHGMALIFTGRRHFRH